MMTPTALPDHRSRLRPAGLLVALVFMLSAPLGAQQTPQGTPRTSALQMVPAQPRGDVIIPFFDGWMENDDGTFTLSFAFLNRNLEEVVDIPLGENNFIEPAEFDGVQPTHFPAVNYGGFANRRERGAFAVTVPADFTGDVVWTVTHAGQTHSVPGRIIHESYQLDWSPQAAGSMRPLVWFDSGEGEEVGRGPDGITSGEHLSTQVGTPLELAAWAQDQGERDPAPLSMIWQVHQGPPGPVEFEPEVLTELGEDGEEVRGVTTATFSEPGDYVLRVRVDNFTASDSRFGNQCCWSNGYVRVSVTP